MLYNVLVVILKVILNVIYRIEVNKDSLITNNSENNYILCANHSSILDPLFLAISYDKPIYFMGKKELFENKILAKLFYALNAFPVDREGNDLASLKKSVKILKSKKDLGIFIEGTRVKEYNPDNAKSGPILIANMANADVLPVKIETSYKLFSKVKIIYREPIQIDKVYLKENKTNGYNQLAKKILEKIYYG